MPRQRDSSAPSRDMADCQDAPAVLAEQSDSQLIEASRGADQHAYAELYRRYHRAVHARAYGLVHNVDTAQDISADAFMKTWNALRAGAGPQTSFAAYLFTAVQHLASRTWSESRTTVLFGSDELEEVAEAVPDPSIEQQESDILWSAFRRLPVAQQKILLLAEVKDLSTAEIARDLGASESATAAKLARAREALRTAYLAEHSAATEKDCAEAAKLMPGYVRGTLRKRNTRAIESHLAHCQRCETELGTMRRLNELLRVMVGPVLLAGGVSGLIAGAASPNSAAAAEQTGRLQGWAAWCAAGLALCLLAAGIWLVWFMPQSSDALGGPHPVAPQPKQHESEIALPPSGNDAERDALDKQAAESTQRAENPAQSDYTPRWVIVRDRHQRD